MSRNQPVCLRDYGGLCRQGFKTCRPSYSLLSSLLLCSKSSVYGQQPAPASCRHKQIDIILFNNRIVKSNKV